MIARRAVLSGAAAAASSGALTAVAGPLLQAGSADPCRVEHSPRVEHPWDKARRLSQELADTLAQCDKGTWVAVIYPTGTRPHPTGFWDRRSYESSWAELASLAALAPPAALTGLKLARHHGECAARAMADLTPGWEMTIVSGKANQAFGFARLGQGMARARRLLDRAKAALEAATGHRWAYIASGGDDSIVAMAKVRPLSPGE